MKSTETFSKFLLNRLGRSLYAIVGLLIFALGSYFQIQANFGMSPWNSLSQGLSMNYPVTFGTANIIVSFIIIFVDILMKEPIGIGTILNAIVIGAGTDVFLAIGFLPTQTTFIGKLLVLVAGIVITCLGQFVYMKACLSCGPRDSLMVGLGKRFPKVKIGTVNIVLLAMVQIVCLFLGSPVGLGTVICVFCTGTIMNIVFGFLKFNPRELKHEGIPETIAAAKEALKNGL
ncbi:MAG: hypothetical protein IJO13_06290 [Lachnospiraceae bacterium]|nr:hypothetical protein [Lachnospiraceae bacterium]